MITFVIPAHNEERYLPGTLKALHSAGRDLDEEYEIIVVDDASSDRTAEIAAVEGARVIQVLHRQIAATRNSGAWAACGDILMFVDADTIVPGETARAALAEIHNGAAGGGARVEFDGAVPLYARILLTWSCGSFAWLAWPVVVSSSALARPSMRSAALMGVYLPQRKLRSVAL